MELSNLKFDHDSHHNSYLENLAHKNWYQLQNGKVDFDKDIIHVKQLVYMVYTSFNGYMYSLIYEFVITKYFDIKYWHPPAPRIIEVNYHFLSHNWIKCNANGVLGKNPGISICDSIFRDNLEHSWEFSQLRLKFSPPFKLIDMKPCLLSNMLTWRIRKIFGLKPTKYWPLVHFLMWILSLDIFSFNGRMVYTLYVHLY